MSFMRVADSNIALLAETERREQFYKQSNRSLGSTIFPAAAIWSYFYFVEKVDSALLWAVLIHAWQLYRYILHRWRLQYDEQHPEQEHSENKAFILVVVFAFIWGLVPWMMLKGQDYAQAAIVLLMLMGMMAGSMSALALSIRCGVTFLCIVGGMLMLWFIVQWQVTDAILAVSTGVFTGTMVQFFLLQQRNLLKLIEERLSNEHLAQSLSLQKNELIELHKERNRFFAAANHDLRQPLQALSLNSQLLERNISETQRALVLKKVSTAIQVMGDSLDAMLDLHQLENQTEPNKFETISASDLLITAHTVWSDIAQKKGLQLRFRSLPVHLAVSRTTVMRILSNLIDNAIKYTPAGGVLVALRHDTPGEDASLVRLEVWDTGMGISAENQNKIFHEFFQVNNPQRDKRMGSGIGLSAVKRLCAQAHLKLECRSRLGKGSVFSVLLPIAQTPLHPVTESEHSVSSQLLHRQMLDAPIPSDTVKTHRVLILDDDPSIADALQHLVPDSVSLVSCHSWQAAQLSLQRYDDFDRYLIDYRLDGELTGLDIVKKILTNSVNASSILLMTGDASTDISQVAHSLGIHFRIKPIATNTLLQFLQAESKN